VDNFSRALQRSYKYPIFLVEAIGFVEVVKRSKNIGVNFIIINKYLTAARQALRRLFNSGPGYIVPLEILTETLVFCLCACRVLK